MLILRVYAKQLKRITFSPRITSSVNQGVQLKNQEAQLSQTDLKWWFSVHGAHSSHPIQRHVRLEGGKLGRVNSSAANGLNKKIKKYKNKFLKKLCTV
jgi:hypothetical protein